MNKKTKKRKQRLHWLQVGVRTVQDQFRLAAEIRRMSGVTYVSSLSETVEVEETMADKAKRRPKNFAKLSASQQWEIDKELGILDWDGT